MGADDIESGRGGGQKQKINTYSIVPWPSALSRTTLPWRISWVFTVEIGRSLSCSGSARRHSDTSWQDMTVVRERTCVCVCLTGEYHKALLSLEYAILQAIFCWQEGWYFRQGLRFGFVWSDSRVAKTVLQPVFLRLQRGRPPQTQNHWLPIATHVPERM